MKGMLKILTGAAWLLAGALNLAGWIFGSGRTDQLIGACLFIPIGTVWLIRALKAEKVRQGGEAP